MTTPPPSPTTTTITDRYRQNVFIWTHTPTAGTADSHFRFSVVDGIMFNYFTYVCMHVYVFIHMHMHFHTNTHSRETIARFDYKRSAVCRCVRVLVHSPLSRVIHIHSNTHMRIGRRDTHTHAYDCHNHMKQQSEEHSTEYEPSFTFVSNHTFTFTFTLPLCADTKKNTDVKKQIGRIVVWNRARRMDTLL